MRVWKDKSAKESFYPFGFSPNAGSVLHPLFIQKKEKKIGHPAF
jgi:hypothetical protein